MELVINLDEALAERAAAEAERRGSTLEALVRDYLADLTTAVDPGQAMDEFLRLADEYPGDPEPGWRFSRAALYDERL